jgi:hypothetical protein
MSNKGFHIAEDGHYSPLIIPHDQNGAAHASTVIRMRSYAHADIFVFIGAATRAAGVITLESCDDMTPTTHTELAFNYYVSTAVFGSASDDIWKPVTKLTATTGIVPGAVGPAAATTGVTYLIPLDADMLVSGHIGFRLSIADPGAASIGCAWAILSGSRYAWNAATADV